MFLSFHFLFKGLGRLNSKVWYSQLQGLLTQKALVSYFKGMFINDPVPNERLKQCFIL